MIPIRVANCSSQTVQFRKGSPLVFAEEVNKITNTDVDDKGSKMNKCCFEPINELLRLSEVSLPEIVKQPVITKKKRSELWMFGSIKTERKRTTRLAKRIKAQTDTQWKAIRGVREQLAHVVKEQKRKTEQKNEMDKIKEIELKKEV